MSHADMEGKVPPPPDDIEDLREFPEHTLTQGQLVWRVHRAADTPWYFGPSGRFGLEPPAGTCYVSEDALTAICETVIRGRRFVTPADLSGRTIRNIPAPKQFTLADSCSGRAVPHGIGRVFGTEYPYAECPRWARAFYNAGLRGIAYWPSHDPRRGDRISYALFDRKGPRSHRWRVGKGWPLDSSSWRARLTSELGLKIWDAPSDDQLVFDVL